MKSDPHFESDSTAGKSTDPRIFRTAMAWVARRDAGLNSSEQKELQAWLVSDARHRTALTQADAQRTPVDWALHAGAVDEVVAGLDQRAARRKKRRLRGAASFAAALLIIGAIWISPIAPKRTPLGPVSSVKIFEARRIALPDGSIAELRDGAEITFDFSGPLRSVTLQHGAAHFQVSHDKSRPFVVSSSGVEVRAVGTAFYVQRDPENVEVVVTEGRVAVNRTVKPEVTIEGTALSAPETVLLDADHGLVAEVAPASGLAPQMRALPADSLSGRLAWRVPRIEFAGTPLAEVVAVMNQHNQAQFVVADRDLERVQISGMLGADKIEALQEMLKTDFGIRVERTGDRIILHRAR